MDRQVEGRILNEQMDVIKDLVFMNSDVFVPSCVLCTHVLGKAISGDQK